MRYLVRRFLLTLFTALTGAQATKCLAADRLICIKEMGIPWYTHVARRSSGGDVTARVRVGAHGKAASILTPGADLNLAKEVEQFLMIDTSYLESCEGQELEVVFTFRFEGQPANQPWTHVRFLPPNHFILITQPNNPGIVLNH